MPKRVAVGTAIAGRPPHRSLSEVLPHTALALVYRENGLQDRVDCLAAREVPRRCGRSRDHRLRRDSMSLFVRRLHRYYATILLPIRVPISKRPWFGN